MMLIAKRTIVSRTETFQPGAVVTGFDSAEEIRLIRLGAAEKIADDQEEEEGKGRSEISAFQNVLIKMNLEEKKGYAKAAGVEIGKARSNEKIAEVLLKDAEKNGVDIQAFAENQLFSFASFIGIETKDKTKEIIMEEIEAGYENV